MKRSELSDEKDFETHFQRVIYLGEFSGCYRKMHHDIDQSPSQYNYLLIGFDCDHFYCPCVGMHKIKFLHDHILRHMKHLLRTAKELKYTEPTKIVN